MSAWVRRFGIGLLAAGVVAAGTVLRADEGFWPFSAVPREAIKKAYGFDVTDEWIRHLQLSSVRFGGASGSFVSADGLVLTNHHVGMNTIAKLSTPQRDLLKHGFYARTRAEELKAPDLELTVLQSIEDVTARVNAAVKPGLTAGQAFDARRAATTAIEQESTQATGLRSEVVTLYQGALYHLYRYKRYTDVRLVFAPEFDAAFFGGDPDNFTYPRYCLDVTIFRVYENDQPAVIEHFLRWSATGAKAGDLVFTSGHPGATQRLNTMAHLEYLRDTGLPLTLTLLERREAALKRYGARGAEQERQVKDEFFGIQNSLKSLRGQLAGLQEAGLMAGKRTAEDALRRSVLADSAMQAKYGSAWDEVAKARRQLPSYARLQTLVEGGAGFNSRLFNLARAIVRLAEENAKADGERLPEFTQARRATLERQLFSPAPIYADAEVAKLADSLTFLRDTLGSEHAVVLAALAGRSPEARAEELVRGTTLAKVEARKALVEGGLAVVDASTDPMIVLARAVDPPAREVRKRYEAEVTGVERDAYAKIAQAVFAAQGTAAYPDGTSTLRLSYGQVKGYMENGKPVAPFTDLAGLFARAAAHGSKPPYDTPQRWDDARAALDLKTPYNFVSNNDIVGGNSGSPVVDRKAEIVGLAFDGNIQSLPGYFVFDESVNRTVSVDARAIIEALRKVYGAGALADELLGRVPAATASR